MAGQGNHYERAFGSWLTGQGVNVLAVDERRRPVVQGRVLKNFDFLVQGADTVLALDVKGRRGTPWITGDDLFSLMAWRGLLGGAIEPALLFAFYAPGPDLPPRFAQLHATLHREAAGLYAFTILGLSDAQRLARPRSARWNTYGFQWRAFTRAARDAAELVLPALAV